MQLPSKGTLVLWNDEKGFGFVRPENGEQDYFVHISAIKNYQKGVSRRPKTGDEVLFEGELKSGKQRRVTSAVIEALEAVTVGDPPAVTTPSSVATVGRFYSWMIKSVAFLPVLLSLDVLLQYSNPLPLMAYMFMTPVTIYYYAEDKRRALNRQWRISNYFLHSFEILGGWPGALLAQNEYRHKLRIGAYQYGFWAILAAHTIAWAVYLYFRLNPSS